MYRLFRTFEAYKESLCAIARAKNGLVEQLHRMSDFELEAPGRGGGFDLHRTSHISRNANARASGDDVADLSLGESRAHFRLREVVSSRGAAAEIILRQRNDRQA